MKHRGTRRLLIAAIAISAFATCDLHAQETPTTLSVVSYNVQFLPGMASAANKRKEPHYRAERIAEELSRFDIVALQETFHPRFRDIIINGLRKAWDGELNLVVSPEDEGRFNGGCLIATRLPIVESDAMIFEHFSTPEEYGVRADGHAAKGVIYARIARSEDTPGDTVDVFVTHLEARADHLRELQYPEFAAFVRAKSSPTRPALLMGDFNTRGMNEHRADPNSQYTMLTSALAGALDRELIDVWPTLMGDAFGGTSEQDSIETGKRIDYVMLTNAPEKRLIPKSIAINMHQDSKVVALSDHNAVEVELDWSSPD